MIPERRLFKSGPKPRRSASTPPTEVTEERKPTELWKALTGDSKRRYRPVPVVPELAAILGDGKAAILAQLDFWLARGEYTDDRGRRWCYNTIAEWKACLPWLSESTIKRHFQELKASGYVMIRQFHVSRLRRENFYSLDYKKLAELRRRVAEIGDENDALRQIIKTKRRFFGGGQPLLNGRFNVG